MIHQWRPGAVPRRSMRQRPGSSARRRVRLRLTPASLPAPAPRGSARPSPPWPCASGLPTRPELCGTSISQPTSPDRPAVGGAQAGAGRAPGLHRAQPHARSGMRGHTSQHRRACACSSNCVAVVQHTNNKQRNNEYTWPHAARARSIRTLTHTPSPELKPPPARQRLPAAPPQRSRRHEHDNNVQLPRPPPRTRASQTARARPASAPTAPCTTGRGTQAARRRHGRRYAPAPRPSKR